MQKVIQVGNSLAVTIDKKQAQLMKIQAGQPLAVVYKPEKGLMSLAKSPDDLNQTMVVAGEQEAYVTSQITPEFRDWVEKSLDEDKDAMEKLANL
jgi:hypothetical protein